MKDEGPAVNFQILTVAALGQNTLGKTMPNSGDRVGEVNRRGAGARSSRTGAALIGGISLLLLAIAPEFLAGGAPGFGPMQIGCLIGGVLLIAAGAWLRFRSPREAQARPRGGAWSRPLVRWLARLVLVAMSLVVVFALVEVWTRWRLGTSPEERRWRALVASLPDDEREQFLRDRGPFEDYQVDYADYYVFQARLKTSPTLNYVAPYGERLCPASVAAESAAERIWFFGGSTMQNAETTDKRTIANQVTRRLNESQRPTESHNFGMGMFQSSLELIKFESLLRETPSDSRPTVVVFYDGFNDAHLAYTCGAGRMQADLSAKLRLLVEGRSGALARATVGRGLFGWSRFYRTYLQRWFEPTGREAGFIADGRHENLHRAVEVYLTNVEMLRAICERLGIRPLFVLQPLVVTKRGRTDDEQAVVDSLPPGLVSFVERFYTAAREKLAGHDDFLDLSGVLDDNGRTDFYDLGHTGPFTGADIGRAIAQPILSFDRLEQTVPP